MCCANDFNMLPVLVETYKAYKDSLYAMYILNE